MPDPYLPGGSGPGRSPLRKRAVVAQTTMTPCFTRCPSAPRAQSRPSPCFRPPPEDPRFLPSEKSRLTVPGNPIPPLSAQARDPMAVKIALPPSIFAASPIAAQFPGSGLHGIDVCDASKPACFQEPGAFLVPDASRVPARSGLRVERNTDGTAGRRR